MGIEPERRYEYLFLDLEWNQKEGTTDLVNREPVQIGILGTDERLMQKTLFSREIRLADASDLTEMTCEMIHVTNEMIMKAKTEGEVLDRVKQTFSSYRYVVVWTRDTYELFRAGMERNNIPMPRHKVVVLQDVLRVVATSDGDAMSFETALSEAGIAYESDWLHCSRHDVEYLYMLFKTMYEQYAALTDSEYCAVTERSGIVHIPACRYVIPGQAEMVREAKRLLFSGYRLCACCGSKEAWQRFQWKKTKKKVKKQKTLKKQNVMVEAKETKNKVMLEKNVLTEEDIFCICGEFELTCSMVSNVVFITTPVGYWRVYLRNGKVKQVLHGNYNARNRSIAASEFYNRKKKANQGFHRQNIAMESFYDVAKYIRNHDKKRLKVRRERIEMLFEQIEQKKEQTDESG